MVVGIGACQTRDVLEAPNMHGYGSKPRTLSEHPNPTTIK